MLTGEDEIASIVSSPSPEDMHIDILTKKGKILMYPIRLEKLVDPSKIVIDDTNSSNLTNSTKKKKKEKMLYEYAISEPMIYDAN